jgi:RimJ/RimL family protein N-acetyltransferase
MKPALTGERVTLRPPRTGDKADRLALGRSPEIVRMFGGSIRDLKPLTPEDVDAWYAAIDAEPYAWMIEHEGRCIGTARLHDIDEEQSSARYAVGILDPGLLGQGLGREVTGLILAHAFEALGLRRVDLRVLATNERAIRSYVANGFRRVAEERHAVEIDGEWHDDVIMAITPQEWRSGRTP